MSDKMQIAELMPRSSCDTHGQHHSVMTLIVSGEATELCAICFKEFLLKNGVNKMRPVHMRPAAVIKHGIKSDGE